jgi:hypothetical protein
MEDLTQPWCPVVQAHRRIRDLIPTNGNAPPLQEVPPQLIQLQDLSSLPPLHWFQVLKKLFFPV